MKATESPEQTKALSELIVINNDRYEGYQKAAGQTEDADLKTLFTKLAADSQKFSSELRQHFDYKDEAPDRGETTASGKVFRVWMDVKKALSANDRKAILSSCEFGEDVAKKTYDHVLKEHELEPALADLIRQQRSVLQEGHDKVKQLRDAAAK